MSPEQFTKILEARILDMRESLDAKAKEYAPGTDRLHNFKRASGLKDEPTTQSLWGMLVKHIVSINDMVKSPEAYSVTLWAEKIRDYMNYGVLLEALVVEHLAAAESTNQRTNQ